MSEQEDQVIEQEIIPAPSPNTFIRVRWNELAEDIEVAKDALHAFLSADYERSRIVLLPLAQSKCSLYGSLGLGILLLMRSLLTFAPNDISGSKESFNDALSIAGAIKRSLSAQNFYSRLSKILGRGNKKLGGGSKEGDAMEEGEREIVLRHADLVMAECLLARALLAVLTDSSGAWMLLMREALNIRTAYLIYHEALNKSKKQSTDNVSAEFSERGDYESGVLLGNGIINMIFSLLPPRIFSFFSYIGYTGDLSIGLSQLRASTECNNGLRAVWAEMALCFYYYALTGSLAVRPPLNKTQLTSINEIDAPQGQPTYSTDQQPAQQGERGFVDKLVWIRIQSYPKCPVFRYFQARAYVLNSEIESAYSVLEYSIKVGMETDWPELLQSPVWEQVTVCFLRLDWEGALKLTCILVKYGKWSKAFALFLQATLLHRTGTSDSTQSVMDILKQVPVSTTRIAGKRLPIEKYAVKRAMEAIESGKMPFYPEFELMLIWDVFIRMSPVNLKKSLDFLGDADLFPNGSQERGMILLCQAAIARAQTDYNHASDLLQDILKEYQQRNNESYIIPVAHAELSQVYLELGEWDKAREHYGKSSGYGGKYILQRSLHLRHVKIKAELDRRSM